MTVSTSRWRVIPNFTCYEVSDNGEVRVLKISPFIKKQHKRRIVGSQIHVTKRAGKYPVCSLWSDDGKLTTTFVHQLVASCFLSKRNSGYYLVRHLDDDKHNNHYKNLAWGNDKLNAFDSIRNGNTKSHTFSEKEVIALRAEFEARNLSGEKCVKMKMSKERDLNYWNLRDLLNKKRYGWVN